MSRWIVLVPIALLLVAASPTRAQDQAEGPDRLVERRGAVTLPDGATLSYRSRAGTIMLLDDAGASRAEIFHVVYERLDADGEPLPPGTRPVTFVFNGGPGSSSVWLHLSALGPHRVELDPEGQPLPPPGRVVPNPETWLAETDLCFIDPVGTGFSRAAEGVDARGFYGFDEDLESVGSFIRQWTSRHRRWSSPKLLAGESYGGTRAAALARWLQDEKDLYLNGVVLISPALGFQTLRFDAGNDLPYALYLPGFAATAWYHGRLGEGVELARVQAAAKELAEGDYLVALARGDRLEPEAARAMAGRLAALIGIEAETILRADLRLSMSAFGKLLLEDEGRIVGRLDARYTAADRGLGARPSHDPSLAAITGPYAAAINDFVRGTLGFETDREYRVLTGAVHPWSYRGAENRYVDVGEALRTAMTTNPALRVWVAGGLYDLATPPFATEHVLAHAGLDAEQRRRVTITEYEAGHMMYVHRPSFERMAADWRAFVASLAVPEPEAASGGDR